MKKFLLLLSLLPTIAGQSQELESKPDLESLKSASEVTWYGFDFSICKFTNPAKLFQGYALKEKSIPGYIDYLNNIYPPDRILNEMNQRQGNKWITHTADIIPIEKLYQTINSDSLVMANDYAIPLENIEAHVQSYKLNQTTGVGMVCIIENLNERVKGEQSVSTYLVFFDVSTRKLLYTAHNIDHQSGKYGANWKDGTMQCFKATLKMYFKVMK